jgi:hypothetical protein
LKLAPGPIDPEFHDPSSPVEVWASVSLLVHVIVSPTPIAIGLGAYAVFVNVDAFLTTDTGVPVTPVPPEGVDGEYELQPTVKAINPATMLKRSVMLFSIRRAHRKGIATSKCERIVGIPEQTSSRNVFFVSENLKSFQVA